MLERCEQIRTQAPLLFAHRIQIPAFQQQSKKTLREIFCLFRSDALSPHEPVNWSPISSAQCFECLLCSWRFALRLQYYTPMSSRKRCAVTIGSLNLGGPVHGVRSPLHSAELSPREPIYFYVKDDA